MKDEEKDGEERADLLSARIQNGEEEKIPEESCSYIPDEKPDAYEKWQELLELEKEAKALKAKFSRLSRSEKLGVQDLGKVLREKRKAEQILQKIERKK